MGSLAPCIILGVSLEKILELLTREYGERRWRRRQGPIAELVQTVLSQNTSDTNSGRAYKGLIASFGGWADVADADVAQISRAIKIGGLEQVKARYIKQALEEIRRKHGGFDLEFLKGMPLNEARDWLMQLPGVGMKTASCVLLFSLGMPAFPVDTHVFRVAGRLGLVDSKSSVEKAARRLEAVVPPGNVYQFHVSLIEHGRKVCKAQRPRCPECVLGELCPSHDKFVALYWS
jgi:endonuclease-3